MYKVLFSIFTIGILIACMAMVCLANQAGVSFTKDSIGGLADLETKKSGFDFSVDAQMQRSDALSMALNGSVEYSIIRPFISYSRDDIGNILDAGAVVNFSFGPLDIAGGASFRGADPSDTAPKFDQYTGEPLPGNVYTVPDENNVNGILKTSFEKWNVETELTTYIPLTKRDVVPVIVITRSQTTLKLTEHISASLVVDARTYVHADGLEIGIYPQGGVVFNW